MARPKFLTYAPPKQVTLEFNRYDPGMYYRNHMGGAFVAVFRSLIPDP